jgi:outer membrane protein assembly factor BamB
VSAAPCLVPDTTILIHTYDDDVLALRLTDGTEKWRITLPLEKRGSRRFGAGDIGSSPTIGPGTHRVYVGAENDGFFYALDVIFDAYINGLPNTAWPKYQHDLSNSGCKGGTWYY